MKHPNNESILEFDPFSAGARTAIQDHYAAGVDSAAAVHGNSRVSDLVAATARPGSDGGSPKSEAAGNMTISLTDPLRDHILG